MVNWTWLKRLFESNDTTLIREVVETNPEVKSFIEINSSYQVTCDEEFPSNSLLKSLKEYQLLTNHAGPEEPKARAAYKEKMQALLRSGGHPESLADYAHPENLVLFEVQGPSEFKGIKLSESMSGLPMAVYQQSVLDIYVDKTEKKAVKTLSRDRVYGENIDMTCSIGNSL